MATVTLILTDSAEGDWPFLSVRCDGCEGEVTSAVLIAAKAVDAILPFVRKYDSQTPYPPIPAVVDLGTFAGGEEQVGE